MRDWMNKARKEKGLTMKEASEVLGITEGYYSMIENGTRMKKLDLQMASKISELFGMTVNQIVEAENS